MSHIGHIGDGRSRETAIFFTFVQSHEAHIALQYVWLSQHGLTSHRQALVEADGEWMYDTHDTEAGIVWFRLPRLFLPPLSTETGSTTASRRNIQGDGLGDSTT